MPWKRPLESITASTAASEFEITSTISRSVASICTLGYLSLIRSLVFIRVSTAWSLSCVSRSPLWAIRFVYME